MLFTLFFKENSVSLNFKQFLVEHKLNIHIFDQIDDLMFDINSDNKRLYCFAFQLSDINPKVNEVNITIYFPRDNIGGLINTYTPLYDLSLKNPDWLHYNNTMS